MRKSGLNDPMIPVPRIVLSRPTVHTRSNQAPETMVGPTRQGLVKPGIVAEKGSKIRLFTGPICRPLVAWETWTGCIAMGPELWFERQGFPLRPLPHARRAGRLADATLTAGGARGCGRSIGASSRRRSDTDDARAQAVDRIGGDDRRHSGCQWSGSGWARAAVHLAARVAAIGHAGDGQRHLVPRFPALDHLGDHRLRADPPGHRDGAFQRPRQSDPVAYHP